MLYRMIDPLAVGLSRLLSIYFDHRARREMESDPAFEPPRLKSLKVDEDVFLATFEQGALGQVAVAMADMLDLSGGDNYVSLVAWHPTRGKFEIVVRPMTGKLPAHRVQELVTLAVLGVKLARVAGAGVVEEGPPVDGPSWAKEVADRGKLYLDWATSILTDREKRDVGLPVEQESADPPAGEGEGG